MIGYLIEQELGNLVPKEVPFATILTMIEVDREDPAFANPTKFVGPVYDDEAAAAWPQKRGGYSSATVASRRRVVPSPAPIAYSNPAHSLAA